MNSADLFDLETAKGEVNPGQVPLPDLVSRGITFLVRDGRCAG